MARKLLPPIVGVIKLSKSPDEFELETRLSGGKLRRACLLLVFVDVKPTAEGEVDPTVEEAATAAAAAMAACFLVTGEERISSWFGNAATVEKGLTKEDVETGGGDSV